MARPDTPATAATRPSPPARRHIIDTWMGEDFIFSAVVIKKQSLILLLCRLPALVPFIFIMRGWLSLNEKDVLTNTEADVLGTGGEICFFVAVSITPIITLTGARWIAALRRWYGIMFAVIGIADATTAALTTDFAGGIFGRLAGHTFLLSGFLIILLALPLLATANTPSQRKLGKYWKRLQKMTYVIWGFIVLHLLLLDGFRPFGANQGDGYPVFHQHPAGPAPAPAGPALGRPAADRRPDVEGLAGPRAVRRAVPDRLRLHHQRGDPHRHQGHHDAPRGQLTTGAARWN
jgi:DMSO/TMAO reductase YedYZ heme-binding membrane subunit